MTTNAGFLRGALMALTFGLGMAFPDMDHAATVVRTGAGTSPAELQPFVDQFRMDLGGVNNGVGGGPHTSGFRAINWDGVPDNSSSPNALPADFFNNTSPRGIVFSTPGTGFQVSADSSNPGSTPVRFGHIEPSYSANFQTFSSERLFTSIGSSVMDLTFFLPSMPSTRASVSGFGAVFSDVDLFDSASVEFLDADNNSLLTLFALPGSLSFVGASFDGSDRVALIRITSGNLPLGAGVLDGGANDLVVLDDFIFGEPVAVPEPSTAALVVIGALALCAGRALHRRNTRG